MKCKNLLAGALACAGAAAFLPAQDQETPSNVHPAAGALRAWQAEHGAGWRMRLNPETGSAQHLYGAVLEAAFPPQSDAEWFELARDAFDRAAGMFALADASLVADRVHHLALSRIGTSDKVAVLFRQEWHGIPVVRGSASAVFDAAGRLLSLDSTGLPGVEQLLTAPLLDRFAAVHAAGLEFARVERRRAAQIESPELVIYGHLSGKTVAPRLAWAVELHAPSPAAGALPAGRVVYVAADRQSAEILGSDNLVHTQGDISGHVEAWASPGTKPDIASNPETLHVMKYLQATSSIGNATTDENGDFVLSYGGTSNVNVTFQFRGPRALVMDDSGAEYSLTQSFAPGVPGSVFMNPGTVAGDTAEANAYRCVIDFYDYMEELLPADNKMDFQVLANVNIASTCNAYFNGSSINFYSAGGGCSNTSYSTVVAHEEGHWANVLYGSGNGSDGFGEGNADVFAMYIYDNPIVGENFQGSGSIRTGNNNRQFCGDTNPGCYGEVHADGEVLMGALWKVRNNLNLTHGNAAGDLIADALFTSWMSAYNDGQIRTIIEEHWLVLDDNDGNIFNGTPNYADIDNGFRAQGFPGIDLTLIQIVHTPLPGSTTNENGPYVIDAAVSSLVGATVTGVSVKYQVNGGAVQTLPMTNTGGSNWSAGIPGQQSVAFVDYWIEASDSLGNLQREPRSGAHGFVVGVVKTIHLDDFEAATSAWTHGLIPNGFTNQDDWQHDSPKGKSTDPTAAKSGTRVWANDVGNSGWNGEYSANVHNFLQSPVFDLSAESGVRVRLWRQLGVEEQNAPFGQSGHFDRAALKVNGTIVWENPLNGDLIDGEWTQVDYDISAIADNNPSVQFRFELKSDGGLQYGGWTIDDFEIWSVEPVPANKDTIVLSGPAAASTGTAVTYNFSSMPANAPWWFAYSLNLNGSVVGGHAFDLGAPATVLATGTADAAGTGSLTATVPAGAAGLTVYLEVAASSAGQLYDSNTITVAIN